MLRPERVRPEVCGGAGAAATAAAAARLARADLASALVMEMTALAGTMGRHYALAAGQPADIAEAIFESVLPRQARGRLEGVLTVGCLYTCAALVGPQMLRRVLR